MEDLSGKTVIVGMSGGVDSSVAALLLREKGAKVIGLFMKNWDDDSDGECSSESDYQDVVAVCRKLDIPYYSVEFIEEYRREVFDHFIAKYKAGYTPNPDVLCNREIKFNHFFKQAMKLGADYLATGHYCNKVYLNGEWHLASAADDNKDQTYFLSSIRHDILSRVVFPLGNLKKQEVREIAKKNQLPNSEKKDSSGVCFIGERNFRKFLSRYIPHQTGAFKMLDGTIVGEHCGVSFYTLGQRKGLGLGGPGEPWFVVDKNIDENVVFVERGEHPALYSRELTACNVHWINPSYEKRFSIGSTHNLKGQIRYRQTAQDCRLQVQGDGTLSVVFSTPQRAIAIGQSVVLYDRPRELEGEQIDGRDICLGGAEISPTNLTVSHHPKVEGRSNRSAAPSILS